MVASYRNLPTSGLRDIEYPDFDPLCDDARRPNLNPKQIQMAAFGLLIFWHFDMVFIVNVPWTSSNEDALGVDADGFSCEARIDYLMGNTANFPTEVDACRQVQVAFECNP